MSTAASINLSTQRELDAAPLLQALCHEQWTLNVDGQIRFAHRPEHDWQEQAFSSETDAITLLMQALAAERRLCVALRSTGEEKEDVRLVFDSAEAHRLRVDLDTTRHLSSQNPLALDYSWFLSRLAPALEACKRQVVFFHIEAGRQG